MEVLAHDVAHAAEGSGDRHVDVDSFVTAGQVGCFDLVDEAELYDVDGDLGVVHGRGGFPDCIETEFAVGMFGFRRDLNESEVDGVFWAQPDHLSFAGGDCGSAAQCL